MFVLLGNSTTQKPDVAVAVPVHEGRAASLVPSAEGCAGPGPAAQLRGEPGAREARDDPGGAVPAADLRHVRGGGLNPGLLN